MKNIIYKLSFLLFAFAIVVACESPEGETNYTPAEYTSPKTFTIAIDATSQTETSSDLIYTPTAAGKGYYIVTAAGTATPSSTQVHDGNFFGVLQSGEFDVDGSVPVMTALNTGLNPGYGYNVHAIHQSTDDFITEFVVSTSFTTPDDTDPEFLSGDPAHGSEDNDLFLSSVTLSFSEQVFYQGGDITFDGFFDGSQVVLGAANFVASTDGSTDLTFTTSDMWGADDAMVGTFDEGTFADNVGHPVAELSGFGYFFWIRPLTFAETIELNLTGTYDYTITDNSGTVPVVPDGQYVVTNDGDEITVLNGIATAVGVSNEHVLRLENDDDGDGIGWLFAVENPQPSIYSTGGIPLYWHPYFNFQFTGVAGEYNFNTSEFYYWMDFADELGFNGIYLGYFEYTFTPSAVDRASTGRSSSRFEGGQFEDLPEEIRQEMERRNSSNNQFESFENRAETLQLKQDMLDIRRNSGVTIYPLINDLEFSH